jgi:hypothetical protein
LGDDIRAVNHLVHILAKDLELSHGGREGADHELLVVDHVLPEAGSAGVACNDEVTLETHLTSERGEHLTGLGTVTWEQATLEQDLEEDLGIEGADGGVEGGSGDGHIDDVCSGDRVGGEESNNLRCVESGISETLQDGVDAVGGLGDSEIGGGGDGGWATEHELEPGGTRAVGSADGTSEVDEVSGGETGGLKDGELTRCDIVNSSISVELQLGSVEEEDRAVSSSTLVAVEGEANSIVESETKSRVSFFTTFTTVEEVLLEVLNNGEQSTASLVASYMSVWASDTLGEGSVGNGCEGQGDDGRLNKHC